MVIVKAAQIVLGAAQSISVNSKLSMLLREADLLNSKLDQIVAREILGALQAIEDSSKTGNKATAVSRLSFAEDSLLRNSNLNTNLTTSGVSNAKWMFMCHLGLSYISALRDDAVICASEILRCFTADPRTSREEYFPEVYAEVIEPKIEAIKEEYERKIIEINKRGERETAMLEAIASIGNPSVSLLPLVLTLAPLSDAQKDRAWKALSGNSVSAVKLIAGFLRVSREEEARARYEEKIDRECREIAAQLSRELRSEESE